MYEDIEKLKKALYEFVSQNVANNWINSIKTENKVIDNLFILTESFFNRLSKNDKVEFIFNEYLNYYGQILELIQKKEIGKAPLNFIPDFTLLYEKIETILDQVPARIKEEQKPERFIIQDDDVLSKRVFKSLKIITYKLSLVPIRLFNSLRIIFKREPRAIRFWYHTVRFQSLIRYHLKYQFLRDLENHRNLINQQLAITMNNAWELLNSALHDESEYLDNGKIKMEAQWQVIEEKFKNIKVEFKRLVEDLRQDYIGLIENRIDLLLKDYPLTGTIEYPDRILKDKNLKRKFKKSEILWEVNSKGWNNTFYAIYDDWRSDLEIYTLRNKLIAETFLIGEMQNSDEYRFRKEFAVIDQVFNDTLKKLQTEGINIRKVLLETKYSITKNLNNKAIPAVAEKLSMKNFSGLINKFENAIELSLEVLSDSHIVVKSENYKRPLKSNELERISVSDLISFEMLPKLIEKLSSIRNLLFVKLAEVNESVFDLDNIAVFALETAITNSEDPNSSESESLKIALEGIERAKMKLGQISKRIDSLYQNNYIEILKSILNFNAQLKSYTNNENILNLKVRIVKSMAIEQSKALRKEFKHKVFHALKYIGIKVLYVFRYAYEGLIKFRKKFLLTAPKPVLSREVSDFLSNSRKKIDGLPILYKSLYRIQPVRDRELFVGRAGEITKLKKAYNNWLGGNYAATVLIGEKWGGTTSLISNFITTNQFSYRIHRIIMNERILESGQLISRISRELGLNEIHDLDTILDSINNLPSKRIIILEDIQKIYLRKVNGFDSLKMLFRLINDTNKNIFWLASCTIYAWNYLKNAISIHEYFSHIILLERLNEQEIVEIIKKRNRISGLNVIFQPENSKSIRKKIKGLSEEEQQVILQKMYFDDLSDFSESNISLALIFWLLSTREITENKLIIGHFEKPDLSFVNVISIDRVLTFLALILHDGLNESELSEVNNITQEEARFIIMMLLEDGVIYKDNSNYLVNPMIYRNVIKLLQSKNLIH